MIDFTPVAEKVDIRPTLGYLLYSPVPGYHDWSKVTTHDLSRVDPSHFKHNLRERHFHSSVFRLCKSVTLEQLMAKLHTCAETQEKAETLKVETSAGKW